MCVNQLNRKTTHVIVCKRYTRKINRETLKPLPIQSNPYSSWNSTIMSALVRSLAICAPVKLVYRHYQVHSVRSNSIKCILIWVIKWHKHTPIEHSLYCVPLSLFSLCVWSSRRRQTNVIIYREKIECLQSVWTDVPSMVILMMLVFVCLLFDAIKRTSRLLGFHCSWHQPKAEARYAHCSLQCSTVKKSKWGSTHNCVCTHSSIFSLFSSKCPDMR